MVSLALLCFIILAKYCSFVLITQRRLLRPNCISCLLLQCCCSEHAHYNSRLSVCVVICVSLFGTWHTLSVLMRTHFILIRVLL